MRTDSGFYTHGIVAVCRKMGVRYSITIRQHASVRNIIEDIPEADWTPIPYCMEGAADVAETTYTPFQNEPDAVPVRLIVRRVKPTPGSQLALFANYSYHAFITDRDGETLDLEADHRRHAEIENAIRDLKYGVGLNHLPSGRFPANAAWLAVQVMAHNLVWYVGMRQTDPTWVEENRGPAADNYQDPPTTLLLPGRTHHPHGPPPHPASPPRLALAKPVRSGPRTIESPTTPFLTTPAAFDPSLTTKPSGRTASGRSSRVSCCNPQADLDRRQRRRLPKMPFVPPTHPAPAPIRRDQSPAHSSPHHRIPSVDSGLGIYFPCRSIRRVGVWPAMPSPFSAILAG